MIGAVLQVSAGAFLALWGMYKARSNLPTDPARKHLAALLMGIGGTWAAVSGVVSALPIIDEGTDMLIVLERKPQSLKAVLYGNKNSHGFAACEWLGTRARVIGKYGAEGDAEIHRERGRQPGSAAPDGFQNFGAMTFTWDEFTEPVSEIRLESYHQCSRLLQITRTQLGPYPVPGIGP